MEIGDKEHPFKVSSAAAEVVLEALSQEEDSELLALWVDVSGANATSFEYDVYFEHLADATDGDLIVLQNGVSVVVPEASRDRLLGATLDLSTDGGLVILNPNSPVVENTVFPEFGPESMSSDVAMLISSVLQNEVNPQIAAHGGRVDLVGVVDDIAYVRLSGGCQGCGMAAVTLSQGIEVAIKEAAPQIKEVKDATDHLSGSNPYYAPAKK